MMVLNLLLQPEFSSPSDHQCIHPPRRSSVSSSRSDRSPRKKNTAGGIGNSSVKSTANAEYVQRSAAEEARLEGGALAAKAVGRDAAAVEGAAAEAGAENAEAAAAEELSLRHQDGAAGEEKEEGEPGAHLVAHVLHSVGQVGIRPSEMSGRLRQ